MNQRLWEKCAEQHGHECGGLTIGYQAALYVMKLMNLHRSEDGCISSGESLVCVAENKACSVDAIRVALRCTEANGNLIFHLTDRQVYTVYNRKTREAIRITLKDRPEWLTREQSMAYYRSKQPDELFEHEPVTFDMPQSIAGNETYTCSVCGETGGTSWFRFIEGKPVCLDCVADREGT